MIRQRVLFLRLEHVLTTIVSDTLLHCRYSGKQMRPIAPRHGRYIRKFFFYYNNKCIR